LFPAANHPVHGMQNTRNMWLIAAVGIFFIALAVTGSVLTTWHMNETATAHGGSAGRPDDPRPNTVQNQGSDAAGGAATTGAGATRSVPPASRP
jgi:hypothetical protein